MMVSDLFVTLVLGIISAIGVWFAQVLRPYIKGKTTLAAQEQINYWVSVAVNAAEQMLTGTGRGQEKFNYVKDFLESYGFNLDDSEIEALIESAVLRMKNGVL